MTVAILGTGVMGTAIALNLHRKGFVVRVWNRTRARADVLASHGVLVAKAAEEAVAGSGTVVTTLTDGRAVRAAIEAALPALAKDAVWLQCSTVGVSDTDALASFASRHRLTFFDAPVLGSRSSAEQGRLMILAAGPGGRRAQVQPVLEAIGREVRWLSETPGAATRLKLALNAWVFALTHGTAESLSIARALGLDPELVVDAIAGSGLDCAYFRTTAAAMLAGDYATSFSVQNGAKDCELVLDAVDQAGGASLDLVQAGLARFRRAILRGHGDDDIAASYLG
jgi:3-hydroxyisobutyrate dehydrogenase